MSPAISVASPLASAASVPTRSMALDLTLAMSAAVVFSVEISDEARSSRAVRDAALPASLATSVQPPQNSCIWLARPTSVGSGNKPSSRDNVWLERSAKALEPCSRTGAGGEQCVVPAGDADDVDAVRVSRAGEDPVARRPDGLQLGALAVIAGRRGVGHVVADQVEGAALGLQSGQAGVQ